MTITTEQLDRWDQLSKEATSGPWEDGGPSPSVTVIVMVDAGCTHPEFAEPSRYEAIAYLHDGSATNYEGERPQQALADARFIAESRTALPLLVAEVRRLRAALDELGTREPDHFSLDLPDGDIAITCDTLEEAMEANETSARAGFGRHPILRIATFVSCIEGSAQGPEKPSAARAALEPDTTNPDRE